MSHNLNSLREVCIGDGIGEYYRGYYWVGRGIFRIFPNGFNKGP